MTEISPLRRRMIEDMTVRNLSPATQRPYVHAVAKFGRFFGRSPTTQAWARLETQGRVRHTPERAEPMSRNRRRLGSHA
jgi:hypothetical protein